ncbi:hypothetical protein [Novosphingobium sp. Leaf2]|uniref:hypothetical protein n=1 Tax=Novosphingobium sp. Leaf2 TaxID=1735670 RepID=UPI0006FE3738|nr:hypothetical protein [Novosphingobium sp. Leaf2]KQM21356.1 hypothetical protein ASE49_14840 [Novosphingobium sp. Leaf2]
MGAWGAMIMGFFGAVFVAVTMAWEWHLTGPVLALPFTGFAVIALLAIRVVRMPGTGVALSARAGKVIAWSSTAEGIGIALAVNVAVNLHRPEWRLPAMALVVGLHFPPIAYAAAFRPFLVLGIALIAAALIGFAAGVPYGGVIAGIAAAASLWTASAMAISRDRRTRVHAIAV